MNKKKLATVSILFTLTVVGGWLVGRRVHVWQLEKRLFATTDAETAASIVRKIVTVDTAQGTAAVREYSRQHSLCAYDSLHKIFLMGDADSGMVHGGYLGPPVFETSTGDKALDEALDEALDDSFLADIITNLSSSFGIGSPPKLLAGIHLQDVKEDQAEFILKTKTGDEWHLVHYEFERGKLKNHWVQGVSDAELEQFRKSRDWPPSWN